MKKIILALFLCTAFSAQAKEITVTAYGEGDDYDWAVMNAVENAVRQTTEITVEGKGLHKLDVAATASFDANHSAGYSSSDSLNTEEKKLKGVLPQNNSFNGSKQNTQAFNESASANAMVGVRDNSKDILAKYKGSVSSYEVLEQTQENGKYRVKIKATVIKEDVYDSHDYKSKNLVKKSEYSLAIMPFKVARNAICLGKNLNSSDTNAVISNLFIEKLAPSRKFNLVDRNNLDDYAAEMALIEADMTLPENKVKLKNVAAADYILVGSVDNFSASTRKEYIPLTGETSYESFSKVKISYRILETATMEIVSAGSSEQKFSKDGAFSSCENVKELLFKRAITDAAGKILADIFPDYKPTGTAAPKQAAKKSAPAQKPDYSLQLY
mgnify:FL=1